MSPLAGVEAPKRRKASENETTAAAMPKWLEIKPNGRSIGIVVCEGRSV